MKIILNKCYGGFDVSKEAYMLYAKKKGLDLFMYESEFLENRYKKINEDKSLMTSYFTKDFGDDIEISERDYEKYSLYLDKEYRQDPILIEVVEELGDKASGRFGDLKVVEISDNCYYKIDGYDGFETLYYSNSEINEM